MFSKVEDHILKTSYYLKISFNLPHNERLAMFLHLATVETSFWYTLTCDLERDNLAKSPSQVSPTPKKLLE